MSCNIKSIFVALIVVASFIMMYTTAFDRRNYDSREQMVKNREYYDNYNSDIMDIPGDDNLAGLIILHGLGVSAGSEELCGLLAGSRVAGLGLSRDTIVKCPAAERRPVGVLPPTFVPGLQFARSWFNFWMMPGFSVLSTVAGESKEELESALRLVENEIEELISQGVPSRNIVVSGMSQGGALTLYTAIHTKYKLGGFVPIVTWLPLRKVEPITSLPTPANKDTPILHMNGMMDPIVPVIPAGKKTEEEMDKVFSRYTFKAIPGTTHATTLNPVTIPILKGWLKENTNLKFKSSLFGLPSPLYAFSKAFLK